MRKLLQKLADKFLGFHCWNCDGWVKNKDGRCETHFGEDGEDALCVGWARWSDKERREAYEDAERHIRTLQESDYQQEQKIRGLEYALRLAKEENTHAWEEVHRLYAASDLDPGTDVRGSAR
jgi:hypothetical protein